MPEPSEVNKILAQAMSADELGIPSSLITELILRVMFQEGDVSLGRFVEVIKVHSQIIDDTLQWMQNEHLVEVAKAGTVGRISYVYRMTDDGTNRARDALDRSQYVGPAPVPIEAYNQAILLQTGGSRRVGPEDVKQAISQPTLPDNF